MSVPDLFDAATLVEEAERERILQAHANRPRAVPVTINGMRTCLDCDEPIEQKRIDAAPECVRCIECQNDHDKRQQRGLR